MNKIIKNLFFAGLDKNQYKSVYREVQKRNLINISVYSLGMFIYYALFLIYVLITTVFNPLYISYFVDALLMIILHFAVKNVLNKRNISSFVALFINYFFIAFIYVDSMILTCAFSEKQSIAYFVRLVIIPVICMDIPFRMICCQILSYIMFLIVTPFYNIPSIVEADKSESISYLIISIIICIFLTAGRIKEVLNELDNNYLYHYDILTEMKNRNSFENEHMIPVKNERHTYYYVYADVNGLHEMNNTNGHEAGDRMLKTVASGLISIFGADSSYRIGGDEFVSFTNHLSKEEIEYSLEYLKCELAKKNYHVSFGIAGSDENIPSNQEIIKVAEQRMYLDKKKFYRDKGIEFGSRKRNIL